MGGRGSDPVMQVKIRLFEERDAPVCADIWVTGLEQTVMSGSRFLRPLYRWGMASLARGAVSAEGDIGPGGCNLYKTWGQGAGESVEGSGVVHAPVDKALFVAENEKGDVVGLCCVKRGIGEKDTPSADDSVFSIWRMSVAESARGNKVGSKLMSRCEDWAREKGGTKMTLVTGNSFASIFYKNIGYSTINFWGIRHEKTLVVVESENSTK